MSTTTTTPAVGPSKADQVIKLLSRGKGATLPELTDATGWQPHSCRAFLTGLRKKGHVIERQARGHDGTAYKIIKSVPVKRNEPLAEVSEAAPEAEGTTTSPLDAGN